MQVRHTIIHPGVFWARALVLTVLIAGSFVLLLLQPTMPQDLGYHDFADKRAFFGLYGFLNVVSSFGFLLAGLAGIGVCLSREIGRMRAAWLTLFTGISFIALGSAYYHSAPDNWSLVWDRLPMTFGFMGLFIAVLGEYVDERIHLFLVPALAAGSASVFYWYLTDDLRMYIWVQALPLITIPVLIFLIRPRYSHQWLLATALGLYAVGKAAEFYDRGLFAATSETVSGHTAKHLLSSVSCGVIALMLYKRRSVI